MRLDLPARVSAQRSCDLAVLGGERRFQVEVEDRLAREVELPAEERGVERRVDPGIRDAGDIRRRRRRRARARPSRSGGALEKERGEIARAEVLDEVVSGLVVRDQERDAEPVAKRDARRRPAPARVRFLRRDRRRRAPSGRRARRQPDVAAPARRRPGRISNATGSCRVRRGERREAEELERGSRHDGLGDGDRGDRERSRYARRPLPSLAPNPSLAVSPSPASGGSS